MMEKEKAIDLNTTGSNNEDKKDAPETVGKSIATTDDNKPTKRAVDNDKQPSDAASNGVSSSSKRPRVSNESEVSTDDSKHLSNNALKDNSLQALGLKAGDRIQVEWDIILEDNDEQEKEEKEEKEEKKNTKGGIEQANQDDDDEDYHESARTIRHWWGATLLEYDGRTTKVDRTLLLQNNNDTKRKATAEEKSNEASTITSKTTEVILPVHRLLYDPYHDAGFDEPSQEDVVFLHDTAVLDTSTLQLMNYRMEQPSETTNDVDNNNNDVDDVVVAVSQDDIEQVLNATLESVLQRKADQWNQFSASRRAAIAQKVSQTKQRVLQLLAQHQEEATNNNRTITPQEVQSILLQAIAGDSSEWNNSAR